MFLYTMAHCYGGVIRLLGTICGKDRLARFIGPPTQKRYRCATRTNEEGGADFQGLKNNLATPFIKSSLSDESGEAFVPSFVSQCTCSPTLRDLANEVLYVSPRIDLMKFGSVQCAVTVF